MDKTTLDRIRQTLAPLRPIAVYLFGSTVAGRARSESDLDLAILPSTAILSSQLFDARLQLAEELGHDVDLIDLDRSTTVLRKEVMAGGRLLFETDSTRREEFEMYALSDYARLNEERSPVLAAFGQPLHQNDR